MALKKTIFEHKIILHIPQQAFVNGKLIDLNLTEKIANLIEKIISAGVASFYQTQVTGFYKGRSYPQLLLTMYGGAEIFRSAEIFYKWNEENKNALQQEAFAYELDGKLFVHEFDANQ